MQTSLVWITLSHIIIGSSKQLLSEKLDKSTSRKKSDGFVPNKPLVTSAVYTVTLLYE